MHRSPLRSHPLARSVAGLAAAALILGACGDDDDDVAAQPVEPVAEESDELITPQLDGLEVTVTGNVTELVGVDGFQIDKDGLGDADSTLEDAAGGIDFDDDYFVGDYDVYDYYDYDYDYYDFGYYTAFDADFDEFDESAVLVVTPGGTEVGVGEAVQVNGTLRYFDELNVEEIYDLDLEDDLWGSYENQYVVVADGVKRVPADRSAAMGDSGGDTSTTAPSDSSSTTMAEDSDDTTETTVAPSTTETTAADDDASEDTTSTTEG